MVGPEVPVVAVPPGLEMVREPQELQIKVMQAGMA